MEKQYQRHYMIGRVEKLKETHSEGIAAMHAVTRRMVFESNDFRIGHVVARPSSPKCGEVECQNENVLVLPLTGVFAKHEDPRRRVVVTPNNAGLIATGRPYRISYPAGIGDKCLTLRFSDAVVRRVLPQAATPRPSALPHLASSALLPSAVMLVRSLLCHRLAAAPGDPLEVEELGSGLLAATLRMMLRDGRDDRCDDFGRSGGASRPSRKPFVWIPSENGRSTIWRNWPMSRLTTSLIYFGTRQGRRSIDLWCGRVLPKRSMPSLIPTPGLPP